MSWFWANWHHHRFTIFSIDRDRKRGDLEWFRLANRTGNGKTYYPDIPSLGGHHQFITIVAVLGGCLSMKMSFIVNVNPSIVLQFFYDPPWGGQVIHSHWMMVTGDIHKTHLYGVQQQWKLLGWLGVRNHSHSIGYRLCVCGWGQTFASQMMWILRSLTLTNNEGNLIRGTWNVLLWDNKEGVFDGWLAGEEKLEC